MKLSCDSCGARYSISDQKVEGKAFRLQCKRCGATLIVRGPKIAEPRARSHKPDRSAMTGARHEGSVLFSVAQLSKNSTTPASTGPDSSDSSGLIDIQNLAQAIPQNRAQEDIEGLLCLGNAQLATPVMTPMSRRSRSPLFFAAAGLVFVAVVATSLAVAAAVSVDSGSASPEPLAARSSAPSPEVAPPSPEVAAPSPEVAAPSPEVAPPSPEVAPPSPEVAAPSPGPHFSAHRRAEQSPRNRPADERLAPRRSNPQAPRRSDPPSIAELIERAAPEEHQATTLSRRQISSGFRRVSGAVSRCAMGEPGRIVVDVVIQGSSGTVSSATVRSHPGGQGVRRCVTRAVRRARFPQFGDQSLTVRSFPFVIVSGAP